MKLNVASDVDAFLMNALLTVFQSIAMLITEDIYSTKMRMNRVRCCDGAIFDESGSDHRQSYYSR
jgi:hypothetical protein